MAAIAIFAGRVSAGVIQYGTTGGPQLMNSAWDPIVGSVVDSSVGGFVQLFKVVDYVDGDLEFGDDLLIDTSWIGHGSAPTNMPEINVDGKLHESVNTPLTFGDQFYFRFFDKPSPDFDNGTLPLLFDPQNPDNAACWGESQVETVDCDADTVTISIIVSSPLYASTRYIPEPSSVALMGIAGFGLFVRRKILS